MALIKCSECGKEFSDKAKACPNCACPNNTRKKQIKINKKNNKLIIIMGCMILCIFAIILVFNYISKQKFIKSYIGGYNTPLINNTWVKNYKGSDNKLIYTEKIIFYDDYTCNYSKEYKDPTFTLGNNTYPHFDEYFKCYYKNDSVEYTKNENITENNFNITIYKLDLSKKKAEIIHSLYYYHSDISNMTYIGDADDIYEINFTPLKEINQKENNTNINTDTNIHNDTDKNNISNEIATISYDEYNKLLDKKNTFILIVVNDYKYSYNYKDTLTKIVSNYKIPFYYYEIDFENNVLNIQGCPTTLIIKNGKVADSFEGFDENETINTLNGKLNKLGLI